MLAKTLILRQATVDRTQEVPPVRATAAEAAVVDQAAGRVVQDLLAEVAKSFYQHIVLNFKVS